MYNIILVRADCTQCGYIYYAFQPEIFKQAHGTFECCRGLRKF